MDKDDYVIRSCGVKRRISGRARPGPPSRPGDKVPPGPGARAGQQGAARRPILLLFLPRGHLSRCRSNGRAGSRLGVASDERAN